MVPASFDFWRANLNFVREFGGNGHAIAEFKADRPFFGISKVIHHIDS